MPVPRRSDARRNRALILRAASQALARGGTVTSLERIAQLAGVGQATVYRHFPDRRALAHAVAVEHLADLARLTAACAGRPDAFRPLLRAVLLAQASMRPLISVLRELPQVQQRQYLDRVTAILGGPLRRAQAAGLLRADLEPGDLVLVFTMLEAVLESVSGRADRKAITRRAITMLLDGLLPPPHRQP